MKYHIYLYAALFAASGLPTMAWSEKNTAEVTITTTIEQSCTLEVPSLVDLGDIPASALAGLKSGDEVTEYATTFKLKANCAGADRYRYTFQSMLTGSNGTCAASDNPKVMNFCLKANGQELYFIGETNPTYTGTDEITTVTVTPQYRGIAAINVTGEIGITIEPD